MVESRKKRTNMKDVAQLAGVSTTTISRFLNGDLNKMSTKTAARISDAIEKLNYTPSAAARQMVTHSSKMIAVIVANIDDYFSTELFKGISSFLEANGYIAVLFDSNASSEKEKGIIKTITSYNFDGIIFQPTSSSMENINSEIHFEIPMVIVDRNLDTTRWPQVLTDNYQSARKATLSFKKEGYEHVIVLTSKIDSVSTRRERYLGIRSTIQDTDIIEISEETYNRKMILKQIENLLNKNGKKTLIFALKERWFLEFIPPLLSKGYFQNNKITTTGFADTSIARTISPKAKLINQNPFLMGGISAELILKILKREKIKSKKVIVPAKIK
ncbi:LacI family DNA-binding transcriptional regulator [Ligilactobacillus pobuzihii]|nr:LacI family DNA-binding transcriptional regulator [Ligilactobacillus pobuzihii]GEN48706.1 KDG operon repressor [Ligilactobacillus pobuzihii]